MQIECALTKTGNETNKNAFRINPITDCDAWQTGTPHYQHDFEIIWVQSGSGIHLIEDQSYQLTANRVLFAMPGQYHLLKPNPGTKGFIISFTESFLTQSEDDFEGFQPAGLFQQFAQSPFIDTVNNLSEELLQLSYKMVKESTNYSFMRTEMLRIYLKIFLIHILRILENTKEDTRQKSSAVLMRKFISLLEKHFKEKKMVTDYASQLSVSPNYLNTIVKKCSGYPASHHIQQRIILEAKRKATYSGYSMKEIAYHLGFDDTSHFSKFFKTVSGNNFSDFRKNSTLYFTV